MTNQPLNPSLAQQWKPAVLLLYRHEDGKWPFKAYAQYGEGADAVYDLAATTVNLHAAWDEAAALCDARNSNARRPSECPDAVSAAQLPAGTFLPQSPRDEAMKKALRDLIARWEEMARTPKGPR